MGRILYQWDLPPTTWVYISSLMMVAIFFKFSRVWSVRNFDLLALIAFAPGLLLVEQGGNLEQFGYLWLFVVGGGFFLRLLIDPLMLRRPLLEPNLSVGGLTFMCASLLLFLVANVATSTLTESDLAGARRLDQMLAREDVAAADAMMTQHGPGYPLLHLLPTVSSRALVQVDEELTAGETDALVHTATARTMAILSHLAIVTGLILIGYRHFKNINAGLSSAGVYLLLPYTAQMVGRVDHVLPAALLVWAVVLYRLPLLAGIMLGLAAGTIYYPIFLLPLWMGFYWQRGLWRFLTGVSCTLLLVVASLALTSSSMESYFAQLRQMFGWTSLMMSGADGFWSSNQSDYRIPVLAAFVAFSVGLIIWPVQKNLGTLLSCSAAVMLGTQFWHTPEGGTYMAWYLPLMLLTMFRPNLEDRVALSVLSDRWARERGSRSPNTVDRAA